MNTELLTRLRCDIAAMGADKVFVITDSNVTVIEEALIRAIGADDVMVVPAGEDSKSLTRTEWILDRLTSQGATRRSVMICIGGGMVTDLGGFAAAIFKRGIRHINVATTLLGAVDASVGGKTGVDFHGLKNEIGAFHMPVKVYDDPDSFATLPHAEVLSGFGEIVKMAFLCGGDMPERIYSADPETPEWATVGTLCGICRDKKMEIVERDPHERGERKVLNLGHTAGHAFESLMIGTGHHVAHGIAVAHGLLVTLILSNMLTGLESGTVSSYAAWLRRYFPALPFTCKDYDAIWDLLGHDKKNEGNNGEISFVLLEAPGKPVIGRSVGRKDVEAALDLYQELQGR